MTSSAEMVARVKELWTWYDFSPEEKSAIQYVFDALDNSRTEALEEAAKIALATSAWREPYFQQLGHRERLDECHQIAAAIRAAKTKEKKA